MKEKKNVNSIIKLSEKGKKLCTIKSKTISNSIFSIRSSTSHMHNSSNNNNPNTYHKLITLTQTQKQKQD